MKKMLSIAIVAVLMASFAIGAVVTAQAKPVPAGECNYACNRTTYRLIECCPYEYGNGQIVTKCKTIGWCYPE